MPTLLSNEKQGAEKDGDRLQMQGDRLLAALDMVEKELSVLLVDDDAIAALNRDYRGKDQPTDVLSFPQHTEEGDDDRLLGDVVISLDMAKRQAQEHNLTYEQELALLLIHGLLHLLGYDHEGSQEEADIMKIKTWELFNLFYPGVKAGALCAF